MLDQAELFFSNVKKREAGKCSALLGEQRRKAYVATTVDFSRSDPVARFLLVMLNFETMRML